MSETPRIYVACLASYTAGHLFGEWFDVDCDAEDLQAQIATMLADSPIPNAEEWAIHDHEGFTGWTVDEYTPIPDVCQVAELFSEHGAAFGAALSAFDSVDCAISAMEHYCGAFDSAADYAEEFAEGCGELCDVPQAIKWCIDWERYAASLCLTEIRIGSEVHLFSQH